MKMRIYMTRVSRASIAVSLHIFLFYRSSTLSAASYAFSLFFSSRVFSPKRDMKENCLFNGKAGITGR